jgi:hypothetical protein
MDVLSNTRTKIWRFWGIPRSGNHAIIEWVIKNIDYSSLVFLNNFNRGLPTETFSYTVLTGVEALKNIEVIFTATKIDITSV